MKARLRGGRVCVGLVHPSCATVPGRPGHEHVHRPPFGVVQFGTRGPPGPRSRSTRSRRRCGPPARWGQRRTRPGPGRRGPRPEGASAAGRRHRPGRSMSRMPRKPSPGPARAARNVLASQARAMRGTNSGREYSSRIASDRPSPRWRRSSSTWRSIRPGRDEVFGPRRRRPWLQPQPQGRSARRPRRVPEEHHHGVRQLRRSHLHGLPHGRE